jgi:diguanylate cyclase (GGDEF)-like protein/PAS domain S-box-containing protein
MYYTELLALVTLLAAGLCANAITRRNRDTRIQDEGQNAMRGSRTEAVPACRTASPAEGDNAGQRHGSRIAGQEAAHSTREVVSMFDAMTGRPLAAEPIRVPLTRAANQDSGLGLLARILPSGTHQRRLVLWSTVHGAAAALGGVLLWRELPGYILVPWLMFMVLAASLFLLRGMSRSRITGDQTHISMLMTGMVMLFGFAWIAGTVMAAPLLDAGVRPFVVLALALIAALTTPLLTASVLAPRVNALLLAVPGAAIAMITPDAATFAAAFTTAWVAFISWAGTTWPRSVQPGTDSIHTPALAIGDAAAVAGADTASVPDLPDLTLAALADAIVTTDAMGRVTSINPSAEAMTGWPASEALGMAATDVIVLRPIDDAIDPVHPFERAMRTDHTVVCDAATILVRRDGSECSIDYNCTPLRTADGRASGAAISMRDVSETRDMHDKLSWAASHDPLTGLINRREFEARLAVLHAAAESEGAQHALCFIDLDHFKSLNDTCGHLAGDDFLRGLAEALRGRVRGADTVARLGGDEFAVLLHSCPIDMAERIAENLRRAVSDYCATWKEHTPTLGASIGVVAINRDSGSLADILAVADLACYNAKSEGRNRVSVFRSNEDLLSRWQGETRWLQSIHSALEENRFELHWQPLTALGDEGASGACELFVYMRDSDDALHSAADFLPTAQRYHLTPAIDFWMMTMVAQALRAHHPVLAGMDTICMSLSSQSVIDDRFERELMQLLSDPQIPLSKLCLQMSESSFATHPARLRQLSAQLRGRGCRIALTDCGTGDGSLSQLRKIEVDFLRISPEFTRELIDRPLDRELVLSLHRIARGMGARTIADQIDTEAVVDTLRNIGIDYAQGNALQAAMPLELNRASTIIPASTQVA